MLVLPLLAAVVAPLAAANVTIYAVKPPRAPIPTADALAAVATLAAYDETVLNSPSPPNPPVTTNFLVQVRLDDGEMNGG